MAFLDKIVQAIGGAASAVVLFVAHAWDLLPTGGQKVLRDIAVAVIAAVGALNLALPHTTGQATAETLLFVTTVVYTVAGILRRDVWPLFIDWVLSRFGFKFDYNNQTEREFLTK
jgi:glucose uptake protein GlcU